jgi:hypothetical protein
MERIEVEGTRSKERDGVVLGNPRDQMITDVRGLLILDLSTLGSGDRRNMTNQIDVHLRDNSLGTNHQTVTPCTHTSSEGHHTWNLIPDLEILDHHLAILEDPILGGDLPKILIQGTLEDLPQILQRDGPLMTPKDLLRASPDHL